MLSGSWIPGRPRPFPSQYLHQYILYCTNTENAAIFRGTGTRVRVQ
jgi:hypothetical protein